ncbi:hypothetical protein P5F75_16290 [Caldifermentibacillus hisashii]|uniref:hypothetical protein n=1 Tax=Caldifermentibacillus hisashii TaxID=996558 RepID=UPI002E21AD49|nr:hypothetical protein [Caldifermentibacillus hisashii]
MTTRKSFVAKKWSFPCKSDDEKGVSSPKSGVSRPKVTTRRGLVAKNEHFPAQKGDEKESRRQKMEFFAQKR